MTRVFKFSKLVLIIFYVLGTLPKTFAEKKEDNKIVSDSMEMKEKLEALKIDSIASSIKYQQGIFNLGNNLATVKATGNFSWLDPKDGNKLLHDLWNNPSSDNLLGVIIPSDVQITDERLWAVVFTYEEDGHVKDNDAEEIKYDELLKTMKEETEAGNVERTKGGFEAMHLAGWAQTPFYDKVNHKLHWAKDITVGPENIHTLNYNIRMLGRKGVLVMNIVASIEQLSEIKTKINSIMASTNFIYGNRYEDFDESNDKIAEYGVAGLIAGGVLAKTGLLAKLGFFLLKMWKAIAFAIVAGFGAIKKFFGKKSKNVLPTIQDSEIKKEEELKVQELKEQKSV